MRFLGIVDVWWIFWGNRWKVKWIRSLKRRPLTLLFLLELLDDRFELFHILTFNSHSIHLPSTDSIHAGYNFQTLTLFPHPDICTVFISFHNFQNISPKSNIQLLVIPFNWNIQNLIINSLFPHYRPMWACPVPCTEHVSNANGQTYGHWCQLITTIFCL